MEDKKNLLPLHRFRKRKARSLGEVAEWSIAAVLKTVVLKGTGGSNPSLSAREIKPCKLKTYGAFCFSANDKVSNLTHTSDNRKRKRGTVSFLSHLLQIDMLDLLHLHLLQS